MNVVFVDPPNPPGFRAFRSSHGGFGECCKTSRLSIPTLDIFHAASLMSQSGLGVSIVDSALDGHDMDECVNAVLAKKPTAVVIRTAAGSWRHDLRAAQLLKRTFTGPIIFFGPQASAEPQLFLSEESVDAVIVGEGYRTFIDAARRKGFEEARGVFHKRSGRIMKNSPAPRLQTLEELPVPRWELVDYERYSYLTSQTSWGCPVGCGYCPYPITQGRSLRSRSPESVIREFNDLRERYGVRFVLLQDPDFAVDRERAALLCRKLISAGAPLTWGCESRLEHLDDDLIRLMAQAGCLRITFGVDSIHSPTLKKMARPAMDQAAVRNRVARIKSLGILTYGMYVIGLPGETADSTQKLVDFALKLDTNAAAFHMATPFRGTPLERLGREHGWLDANEPLELTGCLPSMRNGSLTPSEIGRLYANAKSAWKSRSTVVHHAQ